LEFSETTQVTNAGELKAMMDRVRAEALASAAAPAAAPATTLQTPAAQTLTAPTTKPTATPAEKPLAAASRPAAKPTAPPTLGPAPTHAEPVSMDDRVASSMPGAPTAGAQLKPQAEHERDLVAHVDDEAPPEKSKRAAMAFIIGGAIAIVIIVLAVVFFALPSVEVPTETPKDVTAAIDKPAEPTPPTPAEPAAAAAGANARAPTADVKPEDKPEDKQQDKPEAKPEETPTAAPEEKPEAKPEKKPAAVDTAETPTDAAPTPAGAERTAFQVKYPARFFKGYVQSTAPKADELTGLVKKLKACDNIVLVGHTCALSGPSNEDLAMKRASFVADVLVKHGIPRAKISTESRSDTEPIASNDSEAGRMQNRRVMIECRAP
jgi:OmpA-OmpF porin, OOP family